MRMSVPTKNKPAAPNQVRESRREYYETCAEFKKQLADFRRAGYPEWMLRVLNEQRGNFIESSDMLKIGRSREDQRLNLLLIVPRNFRTVYDQLSSLGKLDKKFSYLEISDAIVCPLKPYCLYNIEDGTAELASPGQSIGDLKQNLKSRDRFPLTDVEVVSLAIQYPELRQYHLVAAGSLTGNGAHPLIMINGGKIEILSVSESFRGLPESERKMIVPSCWSRSN
jgi:hypothetical protein